MIQNIAQAKAYMCEHVKHVRTIADMDGKVRGGRHARAARMALSVIDWWIIYEAGCDERATSQLIRAINAYIREREVSG